MKLKYLFELYKAKSKDEQDFIDKHEIETHPDRNGNGDDVFKGNTKPVKRKSEKHGYEKNDDAKVYEETDLSEGVMKLDKVNHVHHYDHPEAKKFAKEYVAANKGDYSQTGPTEKDEKASNDFYNKYDRTMTRSGFAGSGTHVYRDKKTGLSFKVDKHPNGKTFYGTDHIITHMTESVNEQMELDEISSKKLNDYLDKNQESTDEISSRWKTKTAGIWNPLSSKDAKTFDKRVNGHNLALKKLSRKSLAKEEIINRTLSKYLTTDIRTLDERLVLSTEDLSESHFDKITSLFNSLDEDNRAVLVARLESGEVNEILDFIISNKGEI